MHTWPIDKIKKGNQKDRAQKLTDIVEYLREEEQKKIHGKIERFFEISQAMDEPRIGLKNPGALQNQMIKMACYDERQKKLIFTDIACLCTSCIVGEFNCCSKYTHRIVTAQIATTKSNKKKKSIVDEFLDEEKEFELYFNQWDKQIIERNNFAMDDSNDEKSPTSFKSTHFEAPSDSRSIDSCSEKIVISETEDDSDPTSTKTTNLESISNSDKQKQDKKEVSVKTKCVQNDQCKRNRERLENEADLYQVRMIPRNSETRQLILHFSRSEVKLANQEQRHWETKNHCWSPFGRSQEYEIGDINFIINRWRGSNIQGAKPMGKPFNDDYECLSPSTILDLIKMIIDQPLATSEELMTNALRPDNLQRALPSKDNVRVLAIGLYGSKGLRRKIRVGKFEFGDSNDSGHYICCKLDTESANVTFYDTLNENIQSSSYFDLPILIRVLQSLNDYYRSKRNLGPCKLSLHQPYLQIQRGLNCGCHCLMNLELLLFGQDPAMISFDDIIGDVRRYQFLLRYNDFNEYRLQLD